ncbi:MAG: archaeosine biosynthesis radical SAM protein RaSEA [Euryarchaeota archaeon]|nr:archaeosine biosynthesis radical SAM protein RaSEA [Euryarchaeota archaeon]
MKERRSPSELEALWKEKDLSAGRTVDAMVVIMRTRGCSWAATGGCTMCGYRRASVKEVSADDLGRQIDQALAAYEGEPFVKIYTSGSFLDDDEVPPAVRERIFGEFAACERILVESRPEFVTPERLATLPRTVTLALGLESSDPEVLKRSVNKGFTPEDSRRAGLAAKEAGLTVRTYLLLKPPFLTEGAAIADTVESALFADGFSDEISINPLNIQNGTLAERLWRRGELRTPWLWSLVEVLRTLSDRVGARLMSSPSGGGSQRGAHNCGKCDKAVLAAVERFSLTQDPEDLDVACGCAADWKRYIDAERLLGTPADLERGFDNELAIGKGDSS